MESPGFRKKKIQVLRIGGQAELRSRGVGERTWKTKNFLLVLCQRPVSRDQHRMVARQVAQV